MTRFPLVSFGEFAREVVRPVALRPGSAYRSVGVKLYGEGVHVHEVRDGGEFNADRFEIFADDLIYNDMWARKGSVAVVPESLSHSVASSHFPTFELDRTRVEPRYLAWFFRTPSFWNACEEASRGSTGRNQIKRRTFLAIKAPIPSLAEQRRVVSKIEELAAPIHEAQNFRGQAQLEAQILYAKIIDSVFHPFCERMVHIGDVFRVTTGGTPSRANSLFWDGDINWVSSGEVAFCEIRKTTEKITQFGVENSNAKINPPSTVLIAMIGQGKTRGQCALLDCYAATNQNVAAIHVYETQHSPQYVYWWLFANYQKSRAVETGTAQPALSGERVKQMLIPLPTPSEQCRIVRKLNELQTEVDALKRLQCESAEELYALLPSILDKAFRGEL